MNEWKIHEWMINEWMNESTNPLTNQRINDWVSEWMELISADWLKEQINKWMNQWLTDWRTDRPTEGMIEWMSEWMNEWVPRHHCHCRWLRSSCFYLHPQHTIIPIVVSTYRAGKNLGFHTKNLVFSFFKGFNLHMPDRKLRPTSTDLARWKLQIAIHIWISFVLN